MSLRGGVLCHCELSLLPTCGLRHSLSACRFSYLPAAMFPHPDGEDLFLPGLLKQKSNRDTDSLAITYYYSLWFT